MAYADQQMSGNKITALIVVALLHVVVGYALVTGLAYEAIKKIKEVTTAVKIDPDKPPPPPPPPPPKTDRPPPPPPIVAPPPTIQLNVAPIPLQTVQSPPPAPPPQITVPAPPSPPPPRFTPKPATPKGRPTEWVSNDDYPTRAAQLNQEGTTSFRLTVGTDGKVASCEITRSSGVAELDKTVCDLMRRRGRFAPATDGDGNPVQGSYANNFRWVLPKD